MIPSPKILYVDLKQDDPKKSTMRKLRDLGISKEVSRREMNHHMVLRADAKTMMLHRDRDIVQRGILLIEGSWNRDDLLYKFHFSVERKLPVLIASNPVNYGKREKLSSAEALCAALFITGYRELSREIMGKFHWGHTFFELNGNLLDEYAAAESEQEIEQIQKEYGLT